MSMISFTLVWLIQRNGLGRPDDETALFSKLTKESFLEVKGEEEILPQWQGLQ